MNGSDHEGVSGLGFWLVGLGFFNKYTNPAQEFIVEGMFNKLHLMHDSMPCLSIPIISSALQCRYFGMWGMKGLVTKA